MRLSFFIPRTALGVVLTFVVGIPVGIVVWALQLTGPTGNVLLGFGAGLASGTRAAVAFEEWSRERSAVKITFASRDDFERLFDPADPELASPFRRSGYQARGDYGPRRDEVFSFIRSIDAMTPSRWRDFFAAAMLSRTVDQRRRAQATQAAARLARNNSRVHQTGPAMSDAVAAIGPACLMGLTILAKSASNLQRNSDAALGWAQDAVAAAALAISVSDLLDGDDYAVLLNPFADQLA